MTNAVAFSRFRVWRKKADTQYNQAASGRPLRISWHHCKVEPEASHGVCDSEAISELHESAENYMVGIIARILLIEAEGSRFKLSATAFTSPQGL